MVVAYDHIWRSLWMFKWPFWGAFLAVVVTTPVMILVARKFSILDMPSERKIHRVPVPRLGGLGIMIGFWVVDVASEARAIEIAARVVAFIEAPVEVRPIPAGPPEV